MNTLHGNFFGGGQTYPSSLREKARPSTTWTGNNKASNSLYFPALTYSVGMFCLFTISFNAGKSFDSSS
jgi:hypothetical protein